MDSKPTLRDELRVLRQAVPGALVFVTVLLLLRGYDGTVHALRSQVSLLVESIAGGPDVLLPVLLHTLPLALAAAVAVFAVAARWIRFDSVWSVILLSGIVIAGTTVGGLLRMLVSAPPASINGVAVSYPAVAEIPDPGRPAIALEVSSGVVGMTNDVMSDVVTGPPGQAGETSAWEQLNQIDLLAVPDLTTPPPAEISPVQLIPEFDGMPGVVGLAINQLLGFLVAYQPRLFLAAVLAGAWTGWRWQQRLQTLQQRNAPESRHAAEAPPRRRAA